MLEKLKFILKWPYRALRRAGIDRRFSPLPNGRGWRSAIPMGLHVSFYRGVIDYQYRGVPMQKHPLEMALYPRLLWELKPRTIIEIGSFSGGSAVWFGDLLKIFGIDGRVVSVDVKTPSPLLLPEAVRFLEGDANNLAPTLTPELLATLPRPWLVIEDASHEYAATLAVLRFFDPLLQRGEYIVVEDGNVSEMGVDTIFEGGPARAIAAFLNERSADYEIDLRYCDQYGPNVTGNPNGYLRKKAFRAKNNLN
jgi:cephalosporin hydroxylase